MRLYARRMYNEGPVLLIHRLNAAEGGTSAPLQRAVNLIGLGSWHALAPWPWSGMTASLRFLPSVPIFRL
jgi:hypothetical protein